jgi:hypothetical protein
MEARAGEIDCVVEMNGLGLASSGRRQGHVKHGRAWGTEQTVREASGSTATRPVRGMAVTFPAPTARVVLRFWLACVRPLRPSRSASAASYLDRQRCRPAMAIVLA